MPELIGTPNLSAPVEVRSNVRIPLRDGLCLDAVLYLPAADDMCANSAIVTLTPYVAQKWHDFGVYFATHGHPFFAVDVRGRGNSEGTFRPGVHEVNDAHDVIEWIAAQPFCGGKVAMWGGSYAGHLQWAATKNLSPHLTTIVPVASPCFGVDFPMCGNVFKPYLVQWLTLVSGRTAQDAIFGDARFWSGKFRDWLEAGTPFRQLDADVGSPSDIFREWLSHPERDAYWDAYNPDQASYARLAIPVLTITGIYDGDQLGALAHYRAHRAARAAVGQNAGHCLVIGPWDHGGTRWPAARFGGIETGEASLVDLRRLHLQWYAWASGDGPRPAFLEKDVAYYVTGAEQWRYAESLDAVTAHAQPLYLGSSGSAGSIFESGALTAAPTDGGADRYVYDPADRSPARHESDGESWITDQRQAYASSGQQLIYHSEPLTDDVELAGFFRLSAWLAIDQLDTDFRAAVYEIDSDGRATLLGAAWLRARYREGLYEARLVDTSEPLLYEFAQFGFIARRMTRGCRLRLMIGPLHSIHFQKNFNSGGVVSDESLADARVVTVRLHHDDAHPSILHVPIGAASAADLAFSDRSNS